MGLLKQERTSSHSLDRQVPCSGSSQCDAFRYLVNVSDNLHQVAETQVEGLILFHITISQSISSNPPNSESYTLPPQRFQVSVLLPSDLKMKYWYAMHGDLLSREIK